MGVDLHTRRGQDTGIAFVDAPSRGVCHHRRIHSHQVFQPVACRGKTSRGWFYGFKRPFVVNDPGEFLAFQIPSGNVDDRAPRPAGTTGLTGPWIGDRGCLSQSLFHELGQPGLHRVTITRKNMHNPWRPPVDTLLLRQPALIESLHD